MLIGSTRQEVSSAGTVTTLGLYLPDAFLPEPEVAEEPEDTGWWG